PLPSFPLSDALPIWGLGIEFPLLKSPGQIVNLLFGKPIDLVTWDVPRLEASFEYSQLFGPIIPPFPLFATIGGSFEVFADLYVGDRKSTRLNSSHRT